MVSTVLHLRRAGTVCLDAGDNGDRCSVVSDFTVWRAVRSVTVQMKLFDAVPGPADVDVADDLHVSSSGAESQRLVAMRTRSTGTGFNCSKRCPG